MRKFSSYGPVEPELHYCVPRQTSVEQISLGENYVKFPCPYVQKQLFSYFSRELYHEEMDGLYDPFEDLSDTMTEDSLNIPQLLWRYEQHLQANRDRLLKNAPRRTDLRVNALTVSTVKPVMSAISVSVNW
jgi:hypothetical protein